MPQRSLLAASLSRTATALCLTVVVGSVAAERENDRDQIARAVRAGLRVIETSVAAYPEERTCFSCHHQTLPMQAMDRARRRGFEINTALFEAQTKLTHESFRSRVEQLREGKNIGGRAMTVGYGLWALDLGDAKRDETTATMVAYLARTQEKDGHFWSNLDRPPLEDSRMTSTTIGAYYAQKFAAPEQKDDVARVVESARKWLSATEAKSQEDRNAKLWGLHLLGGEKAEVERARQAVLQSQRADGGWAQLSGMESDAYATGQALFVLQETGTATKDAAFQRGVRYLLQTQREDGSWHVKTRSKPVQIFFDSKFPHGKDQFIAISATSWAVAALAEAK
ncbi:MAG: prenyltransferase/squalene oxidase repeat-containing protein [Verrucomicrobiota bacterium]